MNRSTWLTPAGVWTAAGLAAVAAVSLLWLRYRNAGGLAAAVSDAATATGDALRSTGSTGADADAGRRAAIVAPAIEGPIAGALGVVSDWFGITPPAGISDDVETCRMIYGQSGAVQMWSRCTPAAAARAQWEGPLYYGNEGRPR